MEPAEATALLVYDSRHGQIERIVRRVVDRLGELDVRATALGIDEVPDGLRFPEYDVVLVAGSVHFGRHSKGLERFVLDRLGELRRVPAAFLSVSGHAADRDAEERAGAREHVETFLRRTGWQPEQTAAVAGAVRYTRYNPLLRWLMKRIDQEAADTADADPSREHAYTDWEEVDRLAAQVALLARSRRSTPA